VPSGIELKKLKSWDPYLPEFILSHTGLRIDDYDIERVETGMMNYVFRVRTNKGIFFLKQALPRAKAARTLVSALRKRCSGKRFRPALTTG